MTLIVGLALVAVFLFFATLMFLERLSALLALPLMATLFLLVAITADLLQPATVTTTVFTTETDSFGRQQVTSKTDETTSRFAAWKQRRHTQATLLHERVALLQAAITELAPLVDAEVPTFTDQLARAVQSIYAQQVRFNQQADQRLADTLAPFSGTPHYGGQRAVFQTRYDAIVIAARFQDLPPRAEQAPAATQAALQAALDDARADLEALRAQYPEPPPVDSAAFTLRAGWEYLAYALIYLLRVGSLRLYAAIIATIFGGMFAMYVKNLAIAERLVYWTAEFAGERPLVITLAVFAVTAMIFTSVGGLGTVIMLGTIILPILRSIGLSPIVAAGVFLIALSMGGTLDPVSRRLWIEPFGVPGEHPNTMLWPPVALSAPLGPGWILWGPRQGLLSSFSSTPATPAPAPAPAKHIPPYLMAAPILPVLLVYFGGIDEIAAFTFTLVYMYVCVCRRPGATRVFARSLIEGAQIVMPPILLMVGIGMLLVALGTPAVQAYLQPLLTNTVPDTRWGYIALFSIAAPLALYRGPLNRWGMGLAVAIILLGTTTLPPAAILGVLLAAGMLQGVCDPTNTYNVWIAGFQGITANQILRFMILPVWATAIIAIVIFGLWLVEG